MKTLAQALGIILTLVIVADVTFLHGLTRFLLAVVGIHI